MGDGNKLSKTKLFVLTVALGVAGACGHILLALEPHSNIVVNSLASATPAIIAFICGVVWATNEVKGGKE